MTAKTKSVEIPSNGEQTDVQRLTRLEVATAAKMDRAEALALIAMYTNIQKVRMGARNRESAHEREVDTISDPLIVTQLKDQLEVLEGQARRGLKKYAEASLPGRWLLSQLGIGEVCAAGFLAYIDITRCCCQPYNKWKGSEREKIPVHECPGLTTAGHIWNYAGLNPDTVWEKGQKRPYNDDLKVLCWRAGTSLKYQSKKPECYYGQLYRLRKEQEVRKNDVGAFKEIAAQKLEEAKRKRLCISPEMREAWGQGKLQPIGLDLRAMRYAVKILLSHYHQIAYEVHYGKKPPKPYAISVLGHIDLMNPPNWPMQE